MLIFPFLGGYTTDCFCPMGYMSFLACAFCAAHTLIAFAPTLTALAVASCLTEFFMGMVDTGKQALS